MAGTQRGTMTRALRRSSPRTIRGARPPHRQRPGDEARQALPDPLRDRVLEGVAHELRVDEPEVRHAGGRAVRGQLGAQRAPQGLHPRLADRVGAGQHPVGERVDRGDDEHVAAAGDHVRQRRLDRPVDPAEVDLEHALPVVGVDGEDRAGGRGDPRVGQDDVDPAEGAGDLVDDRVQPLAVADVRRPGPRLRADGLRRPRRLVAVDVQQRDPRALARRPAGGVEPDPAGAAGDEQDAVAEVQGRRSGHRPSLPPARAQAVAGRDGAVGVRRRALGALVRVDTLPASTGSRVVAAPVELVEVAVDHPRAPGGPR